MPHGDVETFHEDGAWHNRIEGQGGLLNTHDGQGTAVEAGRAEARRRASRAHHQELRRHHRRKKQLRSRPAGYTRMNDSRPLGPQPTSAPDPSRRLKQEQQRVHDIEELEH